MANHIDALRRDLGIPDHEYLTLQDPQWSSEALPSGGVRVVVREIPAVLIKATWIGEIQEQLA